MQNLSLKIKIGGRLFVPAWLSSVVETTSFTRSLNCRYPNLTNNLHILKDYEL